MFLHCEGVDNWDKRGMRNVQIVGVQFDTRRFEEMETYHYRRHWLRYHYNLQELQHSHNLGSIRYSTSLLNFEISFNCPSCLPFLPSRLPLYPGLGQGVPSEWRKVRFRLDQDRYLWSRRIRRIRLIFELERSCLGCNWAGIGGLGGLQLLMLSHYLIRRELRGRLMEESSIKNVLDASWVDNE